MRKIYAGLLSVAVVLAATFAFGVYYTGSANASQAQDTLSAGSGAEAGCGCGGQCSQQGGCGSPSCAASSGGTCGCGK
jgi:hypothetical protein